MVKGHPYVSGAAKDKPKKLYKYINVLMFIVADRFLRAVAMVQQTG